MKTKEEPKCSWYISETEPECGKPAVAKVRVKGKVTQATIDVCAKHKAEHDDNFAKLRTGSRR